MVIQSAPHKFLVAVTLIFCPVLAAATAPAQDRPRATNVRRREPNLHAPDLYADKLQLKFTLVNLPGASTPGSYWEGSYQLYFLSEAEHQSVLQRLPPGGHNFRPDEFPGKILLAEGTFKQNGLAAPQERTHAPKAVAFKSKVPDGARTKFARLMTSYSVKIYDARLKSTIYNSGVWMTTPFENDPSEPGRAVARPVLYANFFVSPNGELFKSQWPRKAGDTNW